MNLRRLAPVISAVLILGLWGGAYMKWGRAVPVPPERAGGDKEVNRKLEELRASVLGKDDETRGKKVAPAKIPPKRILEFTPREVCIKMKIDFPDKYKEVDCASDKFSPPPPQ